MERRYRIPQTVRRVSDCQNIADFRELAYRRLPYPVFHYNDGAGDDETTKASNTAAFEDVDLVPDADARQAGQPEPQVVPLGNAGDGVFALPVKQSLKRSSAACG